MGFHDSDDDCFIIEKKDFHPKSGAGVKRGSHDEEDRLLIIEKNYTDSVSPDDPVDNQAPICQKCGAVGYTTLLVYCDVCHVAAEHNYCIDRLSKIDMKVDKWSCVGCAPAAILSTLTLEPTLVLRGLPVVDPVWRGTIGINGDEYGPIAAHISNKACEKVNEAAKALPLFLRVELASRIDVLPKKFKLSAPTANDIGLYFFADEQREKENFAKLVTHMIDMDLALKFVFDKAELIIFPSNLLPKSYREFHGDHYLWGMFKKRTVPPQVSIQRHKV